MYHGLARGHATAFISRQTPYSGVEAWIRGGRCKAAMDSFAESCKSKKPGRTTRRLAPLLRPAFGPPFIGSWSRTHKMVHTSGLASSQESQIFDLGSDETPLFSERAVFLNNLFLDDTSEETNVRMVTLANISHHAMTRFLEREVTSPEGLKPVVIDALSTARTLAIAIDACRLDETSAHSFLLPFEDGALPVVTMSIQPARQHDHRSNLVMSIRTYLAPDMLSAQDRARMGGFAEAMRTLDAGETDADLVAWMRGNSRPWTARTKEGPDSPG